MGILYIALSILVVVFVTEVYCQDGNSECDDSGLVLVNNVIACEGHKVTLQCASSRRTIIILTADYGRTEPGSSVCRHPSIYTTNCRSTSSTRVASGLCDGSRTCELYASNSVFGDTCVGTYKYLSVKFICI